MDKDPIRTNFWVLITLIFLGFGLYFISIQSPFFHFDDKVSIAANENIKQIDPGRIFETFNTRFLTGLSFAINYQAFGPSPQGYRLINLLLHILNAFLVYLLAILTLQIYLKSDFSVRIKWGGIFAAFLFLCHPIQTEAVNFITQRFVLLATFFYLITLLLFIQSRIRSHKLFFVGSLVAALAAMFCKEFVVTLPVMLTLYEFYFLGDLRSIMSERIRGLLPFFVIALIVPLMLLRTPTSTTGVAGIAEMHFKQTATGQGQRIEKVVDISRARGSISRSQYFLTQLNVVRAYVRLLFVPIGQNIDYDYPISYRLDAWTLLSGVFLLLLLSVAVLTYQKYRIVSFGILWFFISLSVESSFVPIGNLMVEYRLYLASVGFVLSIASIIYLRQGDIRTANFVSALLIVVFSILTFHRNYIWSNEARLWEDTIKKSPFKERPYINLSGVYVVNHEYDKAISIANRGIHLFPLSTILYYNTCESYRGKGENAKALAYCLKADKIDPQNSAYKQMIGSIYLNRGDFDLGVDYFKDAFLISPDRFNAMQYAKAVLIFYYEKKNKEKAMGYVPLLYLNDRPDIAVELKRLINST